MKVDNFIKFINPDNQLSVVLAITFAREALPVFEAKHSDDLRPRKAIESAWKKLTGEDIAAKELRAIAAAAHAAGNAAATDAAHAAAHAAANASASAYAVNHYATSAAYWADKALGNNIISDLIHSLIPLIIDYAIQNQVKLFTGPGNFDEVFESLLEEYRDKVWYNLELFSG